MPRMTFLYGLGDVAVKYGVDESIFLHMLVSLTTNNRDNNRNFKDGRWWAYNSLNAWEAAFPWWSGKQIRRIISSCKDQGALVIGEYNKDPRDRTAWYSPSDEVLLFYREDWTGTYICPNGQMHVPERAASPAQMGTTIPKDTQSNNIYAHLEKVRTCLSGLEVHGDDRLSNLEIMSALEQEGYACQNEVPVPTRGPDQRYTGRIGIVVTKDGVTIAIESDRKTPRKKSIDKLRSYPCDGRIILLREGGEMEPPEGIDAVIALKRKAEEDYFHIFWDAYPKKVDKRRAYEIFKRLKVTPELLGRMLQALERQKESPQWKEAKGQYVPYASTWLNGRRWEDEERGPEAPPPEPAPRRYHMEVIDGEEVVVYDDEQS